MTRKEQGVAIITGASQGIGAVGIGVDVYDWRRAEPKALRSSVAAALALD